MNWDELATQALPSSRLGYREDEGRLLLKVSAQPWRLLTGFGACTLLVAAALVTVAIVADGWLPPIIMFGLMGALLLTIVGAGATKRHLTETLVMITTSQAVVKTIRRGREEIRKFPLNADSHARQLYFRRGAGNKSTPRPQGIEIGSSPYDADAGSDPFDETRPRFGAGLSRGELDWLEWRINCFLGKTGELEPGSGSATALPDGTVQSSPPPDTLVRIVEFPNQSRILFPNSTETRTYAGGSSILFGLGVFGASLYFLIQWYRHPPAQVAESIVLFGAVLLVSGLFTLLGASAMVNGMTRLFGRRELIIAGDVITYRARLLGLGVWWTVPTADVLSVWQPRTRFSSQRSKLPLAPAQGAVIRTARHEVQLGAIPDAARNRAHKEWLSDEIAWRIHSAREPVAKSIQP